MKNLINGFYVNLFWNGSLHDFMESRIRGMTTDLFLNLNLFLILCFLTTCHPPASTSGKGKPFLGADLSYVNELEDCGGKFRSGGKEVDPYQLFAKEGANIVRLRLWHTPDWTSYSTLQDVKKSISRAKKANMQVLLDFHYSDTWADPDHQYIPKAWAAIKDTDQLGDSLYQYTLNTLLELHRENLWPEFVQIGNETNSEIMQYTPVASRVINWERNVALFNKGIAATRKAMEITGKHTGITVHIAQPDEAIDWFTKAHQQQIADFDWIGLSYYPKWSKYSMDQLAATITTLKSTFKKRIMIVETAIPHTFKNADGAPNILGEGAPGYDVTPEGQLSFMQDLTALTLKAGGEGVIYWEPAWISTPCKTIWVTGSSWDNATFFDAANGNEALPVFRFLKPERQ